MSTLQGTGIAFVGVVIVVGGARTYTSARKPLATQGDKLLSFNYKSQAPKVDPSGAIGSDDGGPGSGGGAASSGGGAGGGSGSGSPGSGPPGTPGPSPSPGPAPQVEEKPYRIVATVGEAPADDPNTKDIDESLYEATFTIYVKEKDGEKALRTVRGSVRPDDWTASARVKPATYSLHLGFHKRQNKDGQNQVPTKDDLKVKTTGLLRPALILNRDQGIEGTLENGDTRPALMDVIHLHNGFRHERGSKGCLTVHPDDWSDFISTFLDKYPDLADWYSNGAYFVKELGTIEVVIPASPPPSAPTGAPASAPAAGS